MFKKIKKFSQANYSTGRVAIIEDLCTGCNMCVKICPSTALELKNNKSKMINSANCISCGACTAVCATKAIEIESFYNVPDGAYQTTGRIQPVGENAYPRFFTQEKPEGFILNKGEKNSAE